MAKSKRTPSPADDDLDWRDDAEVRNEAGRLFGVATHEVARVADTDIGPVMETTSGRRYVHAMKPDAEGKTGLLMVNPPTPAVTPAEDQATPPATVVEGGRTVFRSSGVPVYVGAEGVDVDGDDHVIEDPTDVAPAGDHRVDDLEPAGLEDDDASRVNEPDDRSKPGRPRSK